MALTLLTRSVVILVMHDQNVASHNGTDFTNPQRERGR